ncbi:DUF2283 domain-containing protein [Actinomadura sp. 7K507]|uniref:DUF2283 domain-containing protein n=1 Tax=Actinomadura sp. 7K507 TaxID=2530365 RepID=UPI0010454836|nr:DUF2283 domain-containing protein [Actinomadura sp. 7K507]TDC92271.1 DUF2283 domain-containing protein [Actinomadura sp. 7K507]
MAEVRVTYDHQADAAYVYFVDPAQVDVKSARTYTCDEDSVNGMINLDFDGDGRVIGVEILDARSKLPRYLLDTAERLDV